MEDDQASGHDEGTRDLPIERLTARSRSVLLFSHEEAQRLGHHYIGTEHLLLGLLREQDGVAARVLGGMGVDLPRVRSVIESITR